MFLYSTRQVFSQLASMALLGLVGNIGTAQTLLLSDTFDRADDTDVDASGNGISGALVGTVFNPPGGVWLEPVDDVTAVPDRSQIVSNTLNLANGFGTSHVVLDYNLAPAVEQSGSIRVSFEAVFIDPSSGGPQHRYVGVGIGGTVASLNTTGDRVPARVSDLFVAVDRTGSVRINDEDPAQRGSGDLPPTFSIDLDPSSINVVVPGTVHVDLSYPDTNAGTIVTYDILFDDGTGEVDVLPGSRTFTWTSDDAVAIALGGRATESGVLMDNLSIVSNSEVCTGAPVTQALVATSGTANLLTVDGGSWTSEGAFFSGSVFGQTLNIFAFDQDPNSGDIFVFENRNEGGVPNRVIRFDQSGWPIEVLGTQGVDFTGSPFFAAQAPNGDLLFTTQPAAPTPAKVVKYEAASDTWIDPFIPNQYTAGDTLDHLRGVTVTPDGRVYICDRDDPVNSVLQFDQSTGAFNGIAYSASGAQAVEYDPVCDRMLLTVQSPGDDDILEFPNVAMLPATGFDFNLPSTLFSSPGTLALGIHSFISAASQLYIAPFQQDSIAVIEDSDTLTTLVSVDNPTFFRQVSVTTGGRYDLNYDNSVFIDDMLIGFLNFGGPNNPMPLTGHPVNFDKLDSDDDGDVDMRDYFAAYAAFSDENKPPFQATGPNIIVILLDDLGYADIGCYGSEISTPTIDGLAAGGLRFRNFYNAARCSPTRCALLTGQYTQRVAVDPGASLPNLRTDNNVTIAEVLGNAGYRCYMSGKWHLGSGSRSPLNRGFEHVFGFGNNVSGSNVFTFWDINLYNMISTGNEVQPIDYSGQQFHQTDAIGDYSVEFINHHNSKGDNKPFFLYMAFNATHWPIEAPADMADAYTDVGDDNPGDTDYYRYEVGYEVTRLDRYNRQLAIGAIDARYALTPRGDHPVPATSIPDWNTLSQDRRDDMARRMAVFAAMLEQVDDNIKKVTDLLAQTGQLDDTLILLCADNGGNYEGGLFGDDNDSPSPRGNFTDLRNMGQPGDRAAFGRVDIGGAWANVGNTPFKLFKHYVHAGGIGSPMIVSWPNGIDPNVAGTWTDERSHLIDFLPTILDASGVSYPSVFEGNSLNPMDGTSLLPLLAGQTLAPRDIAVEHESNRAFYRGNYKFVTKNFAYSDGSSPANELELYDVSVDPAENNNLATSNPTKLQELKDAWNDWAQDVGVPADRLLP